MQPDPSLSLLFAPGTRPTADRMAALIEAAARDGLAARVSHCPPAEQGWLEVLASGLTFDVRGLAPAKSAPTPAIQDSFGFDDDRPTATDHEALTLLPASHILAGAAQMPVVRTMMGLAANLALHLPVRAVAWGPAQTVMEPRYFSRAVMNWLAGGPFPAHGLVALQPRADGTIVSRGLVFFTGQEMQMEAKTGESPAEAQSHAAFAIDGLIRHGAIDEPVRLAQGPSALIAEPSKVGKLVLVWREATHAL
ncbi:hypothetical protein [Novosphingobium sp. Leaf2]|uniref:hypothetical protein n=1 Tax=Novosphingobium sp. Leaf2 TaxID=1735670 RepID=UPI0006F8F467|nr:hypothetical protein [Novosphingobium sp. Leaf2]KQM13860.1 hypothetical protein ASE49_12540 [Novosphingobium sp. Leaf2]